MSTKLISEKKSAEKMGHEKNSSTQLLRKYSGKCKRFEILNILVLAVNLIHFNCENILTFQVAPKLFELLFLLKFLNSNCRLTANNFRGSHETFLSWKTPNVAK